jgi:integral membrane sensor domain MASE1
VMLYLWPVTCDYIQKKKKKPSNHHNAQRQLRHAIVLFFFFFLSCQISNSSLPLPTAHCPPITRGCHGPWAFSLSFFTFLISPQ